jgi:hypothetical protein
MVAKSKNQFEEYKPGAQHIVVLLIMIVGFFCLFQFIVIPNAFGIFVRSLFSPYGEMLEKTGYKEFKDGVWASVSKDNENQNYTNTEISPELITKEYIFDYSWKERVTSKHGYSKSANEFYSRCPKLGENPIIIEPWVCLWLLSLVVAIIVGLAVSMFMPTVIGYMSALFYGQIYATKVKLRLQTGLTNRIIDLLIMPDEQFRNVDANEIRSSFRTIWDRTVTEDLASTHILQNFDDIYYDEMDPVVFRNEIIYKRMKEFYSDFLLKEIEDTKAGIRWSDNHLLFFNGLRLYMSHHFCEKYQNTVTGMAYGGAAFLIVFIGIRGLKFIPADKPSFIFLSIILEFSMLTLMALTLLFTEGEERMDKIMKKMEDANKSSLETQRVQAEDMHMLTNALVGQTSALIKDRVEKAIEEFMTSNDEVEKKIAGAVADKILVSLRNNRELEYKK